MLCNHCGRENPEGATYCVACGQRIDGKTVCPFCGQANPGDAVYCGGCGKRIDGKRVCPSCGTVNEAETRFCYSCGHDFGGAKVPQDKRQRTKTTAAEWISFSGSICLLAAVLFSLIFVFLIGISVKVSVDSVDTTFNANIGIYAYFGDLYRTIREAMKSVYPTGFEVLSFSLYFPTVLGTIVFAGALAAVPVCAIVTAVRFAFVLTKKNEKADFVSPAVGAYCTYLVAACTLLALNYEGDNTAVTVPNNATIAGIVLGAVFLCAGWVLRFISEEARPFSFRTLFPAIMALVIGILTIPLLCCAAAGGIVMTDSSNFSLSARDVTSNPSLYMAMIGSAYMNDVSFPTPARHAVCYVFSQLSQVAVIGLAAFLLIETFRDFKKGPSLRLTIPLAACSVVYLITTIAFGELALRYADHGGDTLLGSTVKFGYTAPIVLTVFAAVALAVSIASVIVKKHKGTEETEPRTE